MAQVDLQSITWTQYTKEITIVIVVNVLSGKNINGMRLTRAKASGRWGCAASMRKRQSVDRLEVFVETTVRHAELFPQIVLYGIPSQNLRQTDGVMKHLTDACESGLV